MASSTEDDDGSWNLVKEAHISRPVDVNTPYSTESLAGKTILITGGASGFGAAFARRWAAEGANIVIGDVDDAAGEALVAELRTLPGSLPGSHLYQHCDVKCWEHQVALFKAAAASGLSGGIDAVVAGAGVVDMGNSGAVFDSPRGLDRDNPPPPRLHVLGVNLTGVMYTTHLALFWLPRNERGGGRTNRDGDEGKKEGVGAGKRRDRHLLLISSVAGMMPLPGQTEYTVSKHAVMGLFRVLRGTSWRQGVRVNVLAPYFVDTPLLPPSGLALLAGGAMGKVEDVVDAGTRLMADETIAGRGLLIGPKGTMEVDEDEDEGEEGEGGMKSHHVKKVQKEQAIWEVYAHDYERVEVFVWRYMALLRALKKVRGWVGTARDLWGIFVRSRGAKGKKERK